MSCSAKVICDSISPLGIRLTTMEIVMPRVILAEFNTHRVFSRNSASSRAIPVEKMLKRVRENPYIPSHWGQNQKGMTAEVEVDAETAKKAKNHWLKAMAWATEQADLLMHLGIHKQVTNRLIEPFMWHTCICSATEWSNFFHLRCNPQAHPEMQNIANAMKAAMDANTPKLVKNGWWHLPYMDDEQDLKSKGYQIDDLVKIAIGRCARVSYLTHDGIRDPKSDLELCERLQHMGHLSPFEHVARPMLQEDAQNIILMQLESCGCRLPDVNPNDIYCGNFRGWMSFRKMIPCEDDILKSMPSV